MKVRLLKPARADLDAIFLYIADKAGPSTADDFIDRLLDATMTLADFPDIGRAARNGRRELTTAPPYVIVYEVRSGTVCIERIVHGARRR